MNVFDVNSHLAQQESQMDQMKRVNSMDFEEIENHDANSFSEDGQDNKRRNIYRMDMLVKQNQADNSEENSTAGDRIEGRMNKNF
eukprot:CAMPEP_0116876448 /NCGR_PEP_ID=MMETSP0463-20121206/8383_1 /TAXON_ID=181622 /ORGANISM="Strombidinopsis sp, Strain SopsisLIS2011" /LENGTH=84 /DNA_ID=CAMNT_0004523049 /DNA_START=1569 /DNA_END=1823 /DNA_ORIENTATION=-